MTLSVVLLPLLLSAVCLQCTSAASRVEVPCPNAGFFTHPDSCQHYYECRPFRGSLHPVHSKCPLGRIFDDAVSRCRPKNLVTSPPRCLQETTVAEEEPLVTVVDDSYDDAVVNYLSVDAVVNDSSVDTVVDDLGVVANDTDVVIQVVELTTDSPPPPPPPTEGNVSGNDTGASEDFVPVGQGINGTSDPSFSDTVIVKDTETVPVPVLTVCDHISRVEGYVTLVVSSPLLRESFEHQTQYNENVMKYNTDLEEAQKNTAIWRNGNSIVTGIRKIYQSARNYRSHFNRKLDINNRRVHDISTQENDQELYESLVSDIASLQEDIKSAKEALPMSDVPTVQQYFENLIASKQQTIKRKQQEIKFASQDGRVLGEYLNFLESVRGDAKKVEDLAKHWQEPMNNLNGNLEGDSLVFKKYASRTAEGIRALTEEQNIVRVNLKANADEQERLENLKNSLNRRVDDLSDRNWEIIQERSRLLDAMERKIEVFRQQAEELCKASDIIKKYLPTLQDIQSFDFPQLNSSIDTDPLAIEEESFTDKLKSLFDSATQYLKGDTILQEIAQECDRILEEHNVALDLSEERERISLLSNESTENHKTINQLLGQLGGITQSLRQLFGTSPALETRILEIDTELSSLRFHSTDLRDMHEGAVTSIESLLEIMEELQLLQGSFETLTRQFDDMIARGKAAGSVEDISRERFAIERSISDVQSQVDQMVVPHIEICTFGL